MSVPASIVWTQNLLTPNSWANTASTPRGEANRPSVARKNGSYQVFQVLRQDLDGKINNNLRGGWSEVNCECQHQIERH